jgi:hypothetical protein
VEEWPSIPLEHKPHRTCAAGEVVVAVREREKLRSQFRSSIVIDLGMSKPSPDRTKARSVLQLKRELPLPRHIVGERAENASGYARAVHAAIGIRQIGMVSEVEGFRAEL